MYNASKNLSSNFRQISNTYLNSSHFEQMMVVWAETERKYLRDLIGPFQRFPNYLVSRAIQLGSYFQHPDPCHFSLKFQVLAE
jgi:hypothetical protein